MKQKRISLSGIFCIVLGLHLVCGHAASAQQPMIPAPDREQRLGPNRIYLDVSVLGASLGYSRQLSPGAEWGVSVSGGAQAGITSSGELTGDEATPMFVELASGAVFVRGEVVKRTELEGGVRVGRFFHREYETNFAGVYSAIQYRIGAVRFGPRIYWGRLSEETGRTQRVFAVVPLTLGVRWSW